jgi:tetratricopeptide (TPR) repeat protein
MIQPEIAIEALRMGELDNAWNVAEEGIRVTHDSTCKEIWEFRFVRAEVLRIRGRFEEALGFLQATGAPPGQQADLLAAWKMHCGYCLGLLGRYERSKQLLQEAEREASLLGVPGLRCEVLLRQAMVAFLQQDYANSDRLYRIVLDECRKLDDWYLQSAALAGVGKVLMIQREFAEAIPWFQKALAIVEQKQAKYAIARLWSEMAVCELGLGHPTEALRLFREAERVNLELGALPSYQVCVANIGNVFYETGDYLKAIAHYERALKIARDIKDPVSVSKWSHNIELAFAKLTEQAKGMATKVGEAPAGPTA